MIVLLSSQSFPVSLTTSGSFTSSNDSISSSSAELAQDSVLAVADKMPQYEGGDSAKFKFIANHLSYPKEAMEKNQQGRVIVQFIVSKTGKIINAKVVKGIAPSLDKEALRIVNLFPNWIPGEQAGKRASIYQLILITFKLQDQFPKSEIPKTVVIDNIMMPANFDIDILNPSEIDTGYVTKPTTIEIKNQLIKKYGLEAENGVIEIYTYKFKKTQNKVKEEAWDTIARINPNDKNAIYSLLDVDREPEFIGGKKVFLNFINNNLKYPDICKETGIQGTAIVQFVIDKTGKVKDAVIKNKINTLLASEATRLVNSFPDWIPGEKHGEKVNVRFTFPIKFKINGVYPLENDSITNIKDLIQDIQLIVLDGNVLPYGFDMNWLNSAGIQSYKLLVPKNDTEEKEFIHRFGPNSTKGIFMAISKKYYSANKTDSNGNKIYTVIEVMPEFPGGDKELMKFIEKNINYPKNAKNKGIKGAVIVRFVVNSTGKIENGEIIRGLDPECNNEALRIINLFPIWIPGKQAGKNTSVYFCIPIYFK